MPLPSTDGESGLLLPAAAGTDPAAAAATPSFDPEMNNIAAAASCPADSKPSAGDESLSARAPLRCPVTLISKEGAEFSVKWAEAVQSGTVRELLDNVPTSSVWTESQTGQLRFPIEGKVLQKVVEYMQWKLLAASPDEAADGLVREFEIEPDMALDMMLAADYLDL
jgi:hypothetical protein